MKLKKTKKKTSHKSKRAKNYVEPSLASPNVPEDKSLSETNPAGIQGSATVSLDANDRRAEEWTEGMELISKTIRAVPEHDLDLNRVKSSINHFRAYDDFTHNIMLNIISLNGKGANIYDFLKSVSPPVNALWSDETPLPTMFSQNGVVFVDKINFNKAHHIEPLWWQPVSDPALCSALYPLIEYIKAYNPLTSQFSFCHLNKTELPGPTSD
jgi:hypothetical protein